MVTNLQLHLNHKHGNPIVVANMSRDKFFTIRSNLKLIDNNSESLQEQKDDKLWKVQPILKSVLNKCLALKHPDTVKCIDEHMIPFTGMSAPREKKSP